MFLSKMFTGNSISVIIDGTPYTVSADSPSWAMAKQAFKDNDSDAFVQALEVKTDVSKRVVGGKIVPTGITVDGETVKFNGQPVDHVVQNMVLQNIAEGLNVDAISNFLTKLYDNSSFNSRKNLLNFLTVHKLTITEDGNFLAYKSVREDYMDKYSGTISNKVGTEVKVDRASVDDNPNNHCSNGLHVGALAYSGPGGWYNGANDNVILVSVDPADVVSVPTDHSFQKLRCCRYVVVSEFVKPLTRTCYSGNVDHSGDDYDDDCCDHDDCDDCVDEPEDMLIGNSYSFNYEGEEDFYPKTRYVLVTDRQDDRVIAELLYPEEREGETRTFLFRNISGEILIYDE